MKLVDKHFPKPGANKKILNINTIKISYSCIPNLDAEISKHNHKILEEYNNKDKSEKKNKMCNCRKKSNCPLGGQCLIKSVIYKATVLNENKTMTYIGSTGREFKQRFYQHVYSFKHKKAKDSTKLSSYIQKEKFDESKIHKNIKWEILHEIKQKKPGKICILCNIERLEIALADSKTSLNSRTELVSKCRHFTNFYLKS